MSSYFFGGFSAYLIEPSGRQLNHSGCSRSQGWSGEHWIAKSSAISSPFSRGRGDEPAEILKRAELRVDRVMPALCRADRIGAADIVGARRRACCSGPCGSFCPIGWIGGKYRTSKPMRRTKGSRAIDVIERAVTARRRRTAIAGTARTSSRIAACGRSTSKDDRIMPHGERALGGIGNRLA